MGFLCTRSPESLSILPFPSYGDLPRFSILEMSGSSSSYIATLVSHLVSLLSSTSLFIFFYPHRSSSRFMNDVSFGVHHLLHGIVHLFWSSRFSHMILRHLALRTQGFCIIYWVFGPLFPIISFTFHPWPTLRSES